MPLPEDEVECAAMVVAAPLSAQATVEESVEIIMGSVTTRLKTGASAARIAAVAPALTGPV
ncbi:hypothetical protein AB9K41_02820 [Cribrihabitans sp. XS_ASV171]